MNKDLSLTYISIFTRKGGDGDFTVVNPMTKLNLIDLLPEEKILILFYFTDQTWTALTNNRLIVKRNVNFNIIPNSEIIKVRPGFSQTNARVREINLFDSVGNNYLIPFEVGDPYSGFFQVLDYISFMNSIKQRS